MTLNSAKKPPARLLKTLRRCLYLMISLILTYALHQAPRHQPATPQVQELRAVWLTNIGAAFLNYTTRLDEALQHLAYLNFNTIYPAVWNRAYTLYPSSVAQQTTGYRSDPLTTLPLQDVLRSLTKQAHRQGLTILPWFEYGLMAPASSSLVQRHPTWVTQTIKGQKVTRPHSQNSFASHLPAPLRNLAFELTGANLVWLNPLHPEVQEFLTSLIVEVVSQYDVDGIQLDDHFGLPVTLGYDPYTVKLYQKEHGGYRPPQDPYDPEWMKWRARKLTEFMTKISRAVKAKKPHCIVSLSPNPAAFAYREYLQDWQTWARKGIIDEVVVQVYRNNRNDLEAELGQLSLQQTQKWVPVSIGLFTGSIRSAQPLAKITEQVKAVRKAGSNGVSFFSWESTLGIFRKDSSQAVQNTFHTLFPTPSYRS